MSKELASERKNINKCILKSILPTAEGQRPSRIPLRTWQAGRTPSAAQARRILQASRIRQPLSAGRTPSRIPRLVQSAHSIIVTPSRLVQPSRIPVAYRCRTVPVTPVQGVPVCVNPVQAVPVHVSPQLVQAEAAVICPPITPEDEKWTKYADREFTPPAEEIDPYTIFCPLFTPPGSPVFRLQQVLPPPEWSPQPQDVDPEALFGQFVLPEAGVSLLGEGVQIGAPPSELGPIRPFPFPLRAPSPTPVLPPTWRVSMQGQRYPSRSPTRTSSPPPCLPPEQSLTLGWKRLPSQRYPSRSPTRTSSPPPCPAPEDSLTLGWKRLPPQRDPSRSPTRYSSPPPCLAPEDSLTLGWKRLPPRRDPSRSPTRYSSPPPCPAPEDSLTLGWKRLPPQRDPSRSPRYSSPPPCPAPEDSLTLGWKRLPPQRDPSRSPMRTPSPSPYATPEQSQPDRRTDPVAFFRQYVPMTPSFGQEGPVCVPSPYCHETSALDPGLLQTIFCIPRSDRARGVYPPSPESYNLSRLFCEVPTAYSAPCLPYCEATAQHVPMETVMMTPVRSLSAPASPRSFAASSADDSYGLRRLFCEPECVVYTAVDGRTPRGARRRLWSPEASFSPTSPQHLSTGSPCPQVISGFKPVLCPPMYMQEDESYHLQRLFETVDTDFTDDSYNMQQVLAELSGDSWPENVYYCDVSGLEDSEVSGVHDFSSDLLPTEVDERLYQELKKYEHIPWIGEFICQLPEPEPYEEPGEISGDMSFDINAMTLSEIVAKYEDYQYQILELGHHEHNVRKAFDNLRNLRTSLDDKYKQINDSTIKAWKTFPETVCQTSSKDAVRIERLQNEIDRLSEECEILRYSIGDESKQVKNLTNAICRLTRDKQHFGDERVSEQEKQEITESVERDSQEVGKLAELLTHQDQLLSDALKDYESEAKKRRQYEAFLQRAQTAKKTLMDKLKDVKETMCIQQDMKKKLEEKLEAFSKGEFSPTPQISERSLHGIRAKKEADAAEVQQLSAQREVLATALEDIKSESKKLNKNLTKQREANKRLRRKLDSSLNK